MRHYQMFLRWRANTWGGGIWNYHTGFEAESDFEALRKAAQIWTDLNKEGDFSKDGIEYKLTINHDVYTGPTARLEAVAAEEKERQN